MRQQDVMYRFIFEQCQVRGVFVRLDSAWKDALSRSDYPSYVKELLGQAMTAAVMLTASLKFTGKLTLQISGTGPLHLLVVQVTDDGKIRGLARYSDDPPRVALNEVFGSEQMSITIRNSATGHDYQGIVSIIGDNFGDCLAEYFQQSEQLQTQMWFAVNERVSSGLLLQKLPGESEDEDAWNRLTQLTDTVREDELISLEVEELLVRLYHEEELRLFDADELTFECNCSRDIITAMIMGLGQPEADSIVKEQGNITVTCDFCNEQYNFDAVDVTMIFSSAEVKELDPTKH